MVVLTYGTAVHVVQLLTSGFTLPRDARLAQDLFHRPDGA